MTGQPFRRAQGGLIDRAKPVRFRFDRRSYEGFAGDTLASALLAAGVRQVGRSFKYHRPRGIYTAGSDEPTALVELRSGARREPNTLATMIELYDGLEASSQNCWPSLRFDALAINSIAAPLFPAGFYYKTFMWPAFFWKPVYERFIRQAAGAGRAATEPDPDIYEKAHAHCDVLVIGAGPAGLMAAVAAGGTGARVILCDEDARFGGSLLREREVIDGQSGHRWADETIAHLAAMPEVRLMPRTTVFGWYDGNTFGAVERLADHLPEPPGHLPRQRLWRIAAKQVILATGAHERPLVFPNNDRPGVILASAARAYANRFAVQPGRRAVIFGNNDDAYRTARDLDAAGVEISAVVDARPPADRESARWPVLSEHVVVGAVGTREVRGVLVAGRDGGRQRRIDCDLICVAGGWNPALHLLSQRGHKPRYNAGTAAFMPPALEGAAFLCAGSIAGRSSLRACLEDGQRAGERAAERCGFMGGGPHGLPTVAGEVAAGEVAAGEVEASSIEPLWRVSGGRGKAFVDLQNDVTDKDIALAAREGYISVEHLKRFSTLGMASDQGKTSNVNGIGILSEQLGKTIPEVGTTTYRPPYTPVSLGTLAGPFRGKNYRPIRRTPLHRWAEERGAIFIESGLWLRSRYFPRTPSESLEAAANREVMAVRNGVGLCDVSTLGKIDIQGPDAVEFLNRVYCNGWSALPVGRARYGLMLREDGIVFDDGTTSRLGEDHFVMTTTTANAGPVMEHLEYGLQVLWPALDVQIASATEAWAGIAIAGPYAREVLQRVIQNFDLSNEAFPHLSAAELPVHGVPARLFRISFSGELGYELNIPARFAGAIACTLMAAGKDLDIVPYGVEALDVMRIEKGHVGGSEINGSTTVGDLGLGRMMSKKKAYIGRPLAERPGLTAVGRPQLVGLLPLDAAGAVSAGAHLIPREQPHTAEHDQGYVTTATFSPTLNRHIALGLLKSGHERHGEVLCATDPLRGRQVLVEVTSPVFYDPEGVRQHG